MFRWYLACVSSIASSGERWFCIIDKDDGGKLECCVDRSFEVNSGKWLHTQYDLTENADTVMWQIEPVLDECQMFLLKNKASGRYLGGALTATHTEGLCVDAN